MNINFYDLNFDQLLIISAFVLFFLIQIIYYLGLFSRVAFYKRKTQLADAPHEGISVIICVKNERDNLERLLPKILEQNYSKFEVIVVNNCSTDDSEDVLNLLKTKYSNLETRKITLSDGISRNNSIVWGVGIKAAKYEWIVLTDANCYPNNENWLTTLQKNFNSKTNLVISYTSLQGNKLVRAGNFADALYYLSKACTRKTYTASGNNMAFRKSVFYDNKGFHPLLKVYDKAEAIFVNTIARKNNTTVDLSPEAINNSALKLSFDKWKIKYRDELRSQRLFRAGTKNARCFEMFSRALFYALFAVALYFSLGVQWAWITVASLFVARLGVQILIFAKVQKRLHEKGLLLTSLIWDFISLFIYLPIILQSKFDRR